MFRCGLNRSKCGLVVLWDDETIMDIQSYSFNHVDMLVKFKNLEKFRFTRIYGYPELGQHHLTWGLIRDIGSHVNEEWVIGGLQ